MNAYCKKNELINLKTRKPEQNIASSYLLIQVHNNPMSDGLELLLRSWWRAVDRRGEVVGKDEQIDEGLGCHRASD